MLHPNKLLRAAILLLLISAVCAQTRNRISGVVVDASGNPIVNARVILTTDDGRTESQTDATGSFSFEAPSSGAVSIEAIAEGFAPRTVAIRGLDRSINITLDPRSVEEQVTILRTDTRLHESPASVVAINSRELDTTAALTIDDRLRQVPGFSLFRRAGSRSANPTTQGVSLRGVGASGASRAIVLADGVPLNDPFGGWVYWGRVPSESISQVEILRGPAGDLYGSSAIGGVISIITRRPTMTPALSIETSYGTQQTPAGSFFISAGFSRWMGSVAGEILRTDGFVPVAEDDRGLVDTLAGVRRSVIVPTIERRFGDRSRVFSSAEFFLEQRTNGTPLQYNDTNLRNFIGGVDWDLKRRGLIAFKVHGGTQGYNQSFTAVAPDRNSESLTRLQHVPSQSVGVSGQWNVNVGRSLVFAGFDARNVRGRSDETGIGGGMPTSTSSSGGRESASGVYIGGNVSITDRLLIGGSLRYDNWRNYRGSSETRSLITGVTTLTEFPDRSESALNPRLSAIFKLTSNVSIAGTVSTGFRRPTLNELYRNFRVGDVLTLANAALRAERATGGDGSLIVNAFERRMFVRASIFCTSVSGNVSNVTISVTPTLITRQRQNVGRTRSCGVESDGDFKVADHVRVSGGYLFVDARVTSFPANILLEGLSVPQIARHQFTFQAEYSNPRFLTASLQFRSASSQFDDDQNLFRLSGFATVDAFVSRKLGHNFNVFFAIENLFDSRIESGRTPVLTIASPRTARLGLRIRFGKDR